MSSKRKVKDGQQIEDVTDAGIDLFVDEPADEEDGSDGSDESDMTDSEESVYSGLEEEEDSSDEDDSEEDNDDDNDKDSEDEEGDENNEDFDINRELIINTNSVSKITRKTQAVKKVKPRTPKQRQNEDNNINTLVNNDEEESSEKEETSIKPREKDEYDEDSSDEEDIRNTVGNIPMEWYQNMKHIGYDVEGRKLIKPAQGDMLDDFLNKVDDPNYWRTVTNKLTGQNVILSDQDVNLIQNLQSKKHPTGSQDQYGPWMEFFSNEVMIHPLSNRPEHKRSFIPSKWEKLKVGQMVHALKMGWMKFSKTEEEKKQEEEEEEGEKYYMLWKDEDESEINKRFRQHIHAPKMPLPGHAESYNPPPEYLFTNEEEEKWKNTEPEDRQIKFIPQKFSNLRTVPGFPQMIKERFERCLDLYLCPRQKVMRMNVDPEDLIPKLPKPKDLQPFPTTQSLVYKGHTDLVRCVSVDPSGQWLVTGSDDETVRVWEVSTGRCMKTVKIGGVVTSIEWNPNPAVALVACSVDKTVILLNPGVGDKLQLSNTDTMLKAYQQLEETDSKSQAIWNEYDDEEYEKGFRLKIQHSFEVKQVTWHGKGDYFASVMPQGNNRSVLIHQLSRRRSQNPFSKAKGLIQCVRFHPVRPFLFVATQRYVRVYNLLKQELSKKLMTNCKWVSSMAVHPEGDNLIIGSYDCRVSWFDLDLSTKPYQTLRNHKKAVRQVTYHKRYPLFASVSDDCSIIVSHGMVYNDLLQNPLIVPVKILRGHTSEKDVGILDCVFHPTQPWIFSAGADSTVRLYT